MAGSLTFPVLQWELESQPELLQGVEEQQGAAPAVCWAWQVGYMAEEVCTGMPGVPQPSFHG